MNLAAYTAPCFKFWLIDVCRFVASRERVRRVFLKGGVERYPIYAGVMCGAPFPT